MPSPDSIEVVLKMRIKSLSTVVLCSSLALAATLGPLTLSLGGGEDSLIQRRYQEAVTHLRQALAEVDDEARPRVLLLLGRAQFLLGEHRQAVASYRQLASEYPASDLVHKARWQQAETLASARRFREAAALYRQEIEWLTGHDRKEVIAQTYLQLADASLDQDPPDYQRAVTFFDLATDLGLSEQSTLSLRLRAAQARLAQENWVDALARLKPLVEELDISKGKLRAMLGLGRARLALGKNAAARSTLRDLIALDPKADEAGDAAYEIALSYGVPTPQAHQLDHALSALDDLVARFPGHQMSRVAGFLRAQSLAHRQRSEDALDALHVFLAESAQLDLPEVAQARAMLGDILAAEEKLPEAIAAWRGYLQRHPAHQEWERVQRAIVDAQYRRAQVLYQQGMDGFAQARALYAVFAAEHPLDPRNPRISFVLADMLQQEQDFDLARAAFARCVSKYPGREESSQAQFRIGRIFESETFDYRQALEAYRGVTWGSWSVQALQRIALLERKHLQLETRRSFRSGEAAEFMLSVRNIEKLRVRIYRLDLETWFRATYLPGQVELLDIEVITPDQTILSETPEYQPYQQTERAVGIGYEEPGAYVVKVDDGELEATTMVLISDLGMIAKVSRHEFFVFTQNLKEDRVEAGVRVLLSDGERIIAEGLTGEDGVWRYQGEELKNLDQLRAFAVNASGSGAGSLDLSGMGFGQGLMAKGYLYCDRPAYAPGETVQIKGIVREADAGLYRLPVGDDYRLRISSAAGQLILQQAIQFTDFGTFAVDLDLPPQADLGSWQILVDREGDVSTVFTGSFEVARFELPRLMIHAEGVAPVVYRGELIEGSFMLRHFYGEPAIGKVVSYHLALPDGSRIERLGTSNAEGRVSFRFETREFAEEAIARISARVVEDKAETQLLVPVVTREFIPSLSTLRSVYLAGEPFDVSITLEDRSGKPLARPGKLRLFERKLRGRVIAEVEVSAKEFRSRSEDGAATVVMQAARGGSYILRVECQDRFDNAVSAELTLTISGDDDEIKLRMLSDRQSYEVGETLQVKIVNRAGPRLVLRTVQGDGILSYDSLRLPAGESIMEIPLEALHAPNFALALAMIDGQELRLVQRDFLVSGDLKVTVRPKQREVVPGGKVEIEISTHDTRGRPVAAEVSLAVVDAALLALYPDQSPEITQFFYGHRRQTEFRSSSSCAWSYRGESRRVSEDLVSEDRRLLERKKSALGGGRSPGLAGPGSELIVHSDEFFMGAPTIRGRGRFSGRVSQTQVLKFDLENLSYASLHSRTDRGSLNYTIDSFDLPMFLDVSKTPVDILGRQRAAPRPFNQPRSAFSPQGAWWSSIRTDASGRATVTLELPAASSTWKLLARGVTRDSYFGEARAELRSARSLEVDLLSPAALVAGDSSEVSLRIHNRGEAAKQLNLILSGSEFSRQLDLPAGREHVEGVAVSAAEGSASLELELLVSGDIDASVARKIPVLPFGIEQRSSQAGVVSDQLAFGLRLPAGREYTDLSLRIELGLDPARDLIAMALGIGFRPASCYRIDGTNEAIASRGLGALTVLGYLEANSAAAASDRHRLQGMGLSAVTMLLAAQRQDGSFAWIGKRAGDLRSTSQALRLYALARRRGPGSVDASLDRAANWLLAALRGAPEAARAEAVLALAEVGRVRFETLNSLHRGRASLGLESLARLALAWQAADRGEMVAELVAPLTGKLRLGFRGDARNITAVGLAARALLNHDSSSQEARRAMSWLGGRRQGASFGTPMATAAVLEALVAASDVVRARSSEARVSLQVNGRQVEDLESGLTGKRMVLEIPAEWLTASNNRIEISLIGESPLHFSATLSGFTAGIRPEDRNDRQISIQRQYLPAYLRSGDRQVPQGFSVVSGRYQPFTNLMTQLPVGASGRVSFSFYLREENISSPLIVEEPIPAGCSVAKDSIRGNFEHLIVEPGRLIFYYQEGRRSDSVSYELQGRFPGRYRALPTKVYAALRPDFLAYGPVGEIEILPRATEVQDEYQMTPDELRYLGEAHYDAGEYQQAGVYLRELVAGWALRDDVFKEVARMMLFVAIEAGDSDAVVEYFEQLKDRHPELVIPFDKIVAVGQSYIDLGEFEAALLVFRATAESSFLKDAAVATTLENMGEVARSLRFLRDLLVSYPDLATMRGSLYGIGQRLAEFAAGIADGALVDDRLGSRGHLRAAALEAFREFLIMYPEDALAEQVSFAWATTMVEGEDLQGALEVAQAAIARYPESDLLDELLYTVGFVHFAIGASAEAFTILERVASESFVMPNGGHGDSENRAHAVYLMGQIHHALGHPKEALEAYDKVKDLFSDAGEAADYFRRKELELPEVSSFGLKDKVELEINFRNLSEIKLQIYRVDLMRLYILHKSLNNIRNIRLHGIAPYAELSMEPGDGEDYSDHTETLDLDLTDPGAYLVVARSGDLIASGMILRSDLGVEVQEDLDHGRIRVNVKRGEQFEGAVHVKVVGSGDRQLRSGDTDLRGIFVADGLIGEATVIVKSGEEFGFYRGKGIHQPNQYQPPRLPKVKRPPATDKAGKPFDAWDNNFRLNQQYRSQQMNWLQEQVLQKQQKGVEVYRTK